MLEMQSQDDGLWARETAAFLKQRVSSPRFVVKHLHSVLTDQIFV